MTMKKKIINSSVRGCCYFVFFTKQEKKQQLLNNFIFLCGLFLHTRTHKYTYTLSYRWPYFCCKGVYNLRKHINIHFFPSARSNIGFLYQFFVRLFLKYLQPEFLYYVFLLLRIFPPFPNIKGTKMFLCLAFCLD